MGALTARDGARRVVHLPAPWGTSAYLLAEHGQADLPAVWTADDALLAVVDGPGHDPGLVGLGAPGAVAALCDRAALAARDGDPALSRVRFATLERRSIPALRPGVLADLGLAAEGSSWDWMWTDRPLAADPARAERLPPGPVTAAEVAECLAHAHPTASTGPDDGRVIGWWGVRQDGRLRAVIGAIRRAPGLPPHLVSLGVDPSARGRGLAGTVISAAVRDCLQVRPEVGAPMVSLGLYASNEVARRVYTRLGFRLEHSFASRRRLGGRRPGG